VFVLQGEQCAHNESIGQGWGIQTVNNVICNGLLSTWLIWWNTLATRCYYNKKNNVTLVWVHPLAPGWHSSPFRALIHDLGSWPEFLWMVSGYQINEATFDHTFYTS